MNASDKWPDRFWVLPSTHTPLPIERVAEFPLLQACLSVWCAAHAVGLPSTIDPLDLPVRAIQGVSLLQWDDSVGDWVFRLSSSLIDDGHGRSMKGTGLTEGFPPQEVDRVRDQITAVVATGMADLMRREFSDPTGRVWSYVRLILPLSSDGVKRDRYVLVIDPTTFGRRIG